MTCKTLSGVRSSRLQRFETALEATYRLGFSRDAFFFQPDLQYIIRPGGTDRTSNAVVIGFQTGSTFELEAPQPLFHRKISKTLLHEKLNQ